MNMLLYIINLILVHDIKRWKVFFQFPKTRLCIKPGIQERETRGMGGMLLNIPGNIDKHSGKCHQILREMLLNIPGNVLKHSGECRLTFLGVLPNILWNVAEHSRECCKAFRGMA